LYAGYQATNADNSNFIGQSAGNSATNANQSNFLGQSAGYSATNANYSNFLGYYAGQGATNAITSNFLGYQAGQYSTEANRSNFIGTNAGQAATNAAYSNFLGFSTGYQAASASYSVLLGYQAGYNTAGGALGVKSNNIIIGTNITLPDGAKDSINLGGIIFATGSYATTTGSPSAAASANGKMGIGIVSPTATLHLTGSTTAAAMMRLTVGAAPSAPNDGDVWLESNTNTGLKIRINGVTKTITLS